MPYLAQDLPFFLRRKNRDFFSTFEKLWLKRFKRRLLYKNIQGSRQDIVNWIRNRKKDIYKRTLDDKSEGKNEVWERRDKVTSDSDLRKKWFFEREERARLSWLKWNDWAECKKPIVKRRYRTWSWRERGQSTRKNIGLTRGFKCKPIENSIR